MAVMSVSETEFKNKKGAEMNYKINDKIAHFLFVYKTKTLSLVRYLSFLFVPFCSQLHLNLMGEEM
jgi:hypothetical protein